MLWRLRILLQSSGIKNKYESFQLENFEIYFININKFSCEDFKKFPWDYVLA